MLEKLYVLYLVLFRLSLPLMNFLLLCNYWNQMQSESYLVQMCLYNELAFVLGLENVVIGLLSTFTEGFSLFPIVFIIWGIFIKSKQDSNSLINLEQIFHDGGYSYAQFNEAFFQLTYLANLTIFYIIVAVFVFTSIIIIVFVIWFSPRLIPRSFDLIQEAPPQGIEDAFQLQFDELIDSQQIKLEELSYEQLIDLKQKGFLHGDQEQCCICLQNYLEKDLLVKLSCNHYFHKVCIIPWIQSNQNHTCPLCRENL